jgi:Restriction endonuclease
VSFVDTVHEVTAFFMTKYPVDSPPTVLSDRVETLLLENYSSEFTSQFISQFLGRVQRILIDEFNNRFEKPHSLRFRFLDDSGERIVGIGHTNQHEKIEFQNAINELSSYEFEALSAYVLKVAGCAHYWSTPESHDQGLDAFGYFPFFERTTGEWFAGIPRVIFLAQAKHFKSVKVGSKDIREFIGSYELAVHRIYSTVDERYADLDIPPFAPVALMFITTEEVPLTVKRLGIRAGVIVLTSDDLYDLLVTKWPRRPKSLTKTWILKQIRHSIKNIPKAT